MKIKDITGQRFGKLVVVRLLKTRTKSGATLWLCKCDCGKSKKIRKDKLRKIKSCGCLRNNRSPETWIGRRFERLTVIYPMPERDKTGNLVLMCKCDCGKFKKICSTNLRSGKIKSCGCLRKELVKIKARKLPNEAYTKYPNSNKRNAAYLTDIYIKSLLVDGRAFSFKDISPELIKLKRESLKIKRLIKKRQKEK